jgi:hypothetical protein
VNRERVASGERAGTGKGTQMKTGWMLSSAIVLGLGMGFTQAQATPGDALGPDPFQIFFDEFGTGFYQVFNPVTGQYGPIVNNPGTVVGGFLQYSLPEAVTLGDVAIAGPDRGEPCTTVANCGDGLRFFQTGANFFMLYWSDPAEALADSGPPPNFSVAFIGANETGPEDVFESFRYAAGPGPLATTNFYNGVSDGRIPEPASLAILAVSLLGMGAYRRFRK